MFNLNAIYALLLREAKVYFREKERIVSILISPLLFLVVIGGGFGLAALNGSEAAKDPGLAGGLDGGVTNGRVLLLRCAVKPVPGLASDSTSLGRQGLG